MTKNKNIEKYLWMVTVLFITYLLVGSFIESSNFLDVIYLIVLYIFIIFTKIVNKKQ